MSGIFINSDTWNFWFLLKDFSVEEIQKDVDFYTKKGGVEAILYNMNFQRAFFPSKVFTPIWKDCELDANGDLLLRGKKVDDSYKPLVLNCKKMWEKHPDFLKIRYDYCHKRGVEMWHSMRMNDAHHSIIHQEHSPQHSDLWQQRKDLLRAWYRHFERQIWEDNAFDYGKTEVYQYHLAFVREYLMEYESDGIELDWHRTLPIFKPGYDELNKNILTSFIRDVRKIANEAAAKWGHRVRVASQVPYCVDDAMSMGFDVPAWVKENLVDVLIPVPHHHFTHVNPQTALWRLLAPKPVIIAPCIDCGHGSATGYSGSHSIESNTGFASSFYEMGADSVYFYNHFPTVQFSGIHDFFSIAGNPDELDKHARRHIHTQHEAQGEGHFQTSCYPPIIWGTCSNGSVKINAGRHTKGRNARIVYGFTKPVDIELRLNAVACPLLPQDHPLPSPLPKKEAFYVQAQIPDGLLHDGWNVVEIFNKAHESILEKEMVWLEIDVDAAQN